MIMMDESVMRCVSGVDTTSKTEDSEFNPGNHLNEDFLNSVLEVNNFVYVCILHAAVAFTALLRQARLEILTAYERTTPFVFLFYFVYNHPAIV